MYSCGRDNAAFIRLEWELLNPFDNYKTQHASRWLEIFNDLESPILIGFTDQLSPVALRSLFCVAEHLHGDINAAHWTILVGCAGTWLGDNRVHQHDACVRFERRSQCLENFDDIFVGPVVQDPTEEVDISPMQRLRGEEVVLHEVDVFARCSRRMGDNFGAVLHNDPQIWVMIQNYGSNGSVTTSEINNGSVRMSTPIILQHMFGFKTGRLLDDCRQQQVSVWSGRP